MLEFKLGCYKIAGTSLITSKFSSSIFLLERTTQISGGREQEHQTQAIASECWCFCLRPLTHLLQPQGILLNDNPRCYSKSIHGCNNVDSPYSTIPCERTVKRYTSWVLFLKILRVQSVWRIQSNHFSGIFYPKRGLFEYRI